VKIDWNLLKPGVIDWKLWKPRLLYGGFFALAFLVALRQTFPTEAVKERLILEAAAKGWQLDADSVAPAGLVGISARNVRLEDHTGSKLSADAVSLSLRPLALLAGRRSISFDARLWDGRIRGDADLSGAERRIEARVENVELARATPLRRASGIEMVGTVNGTADLVLPEDPQGKPRGRMELTVKEAGVNGGQLPIPALGGGLSLPKLSLGEVAAELALEDGKGTFKKLEAKGGDAELSTEGLYFVWQPRLEYAPIFGKARVKVADAFWTRSGTAGFKSMVEMTLASAKASDGAYRFQVYGSLLHPQMRPGQ
jgi:type II secretion system protein N